MKVSHVVAIVSMNSLHCQESHEFYWDHSFEKGLLFTCNLISLLIREDSLYWINNKREWTAHGQVCIFFPRKERKHFLREERKY